jgi:hypothetical protein
VTRPNENSRDIAISAVSPGSGMGGTRLEQTSSLPANSQPQLANDAQNNAHSNELTQIIEHWPTLPQATRAIILKLVGGSRLGDDEIDRPALG